MKKQNMIVKTIGILLITLMSLGFANAKEMQPIPEQLLLNKPNMTIDTGIPPLKMYFFSTYTPKDRWRILLAKHKEIEFTQDELKSLQLRETYNSNRLTIDKGLERVEIAIAGTEIEREWLFEYLQASYSISTP